MAENETASRQRDAAADPRERDEAPVRERWEVRRVADDAGQPSPEARKREEPPHDQHEEAAEDPAAARRRKRRRWAVGGLVVALLLAGLVWYAVHWLRIGRYLVETDDAYTQADNVVLSPQVAGYVSELRVIDNQRVRRGDLIAVIDQRSPARGS